MIKEIANLPDVSVIDGITLSAIQAKMVALYREKYRQINGKDITLRAGEPEALKIYAVSVILFQLYEIVEKAGRMDLLKYAYGAFLDHLGAVRGVTRLPSYPAKTVVRFTLSAAQPNAITIPAGTRVSDGDLLYFATDGAAEIPIGEMYADIPCTCLEDGSGGNGVMPGGINNLVDLLPYIESVANTETTAGGADVESDDDLAERIYLAPGGYSVAGPEGAYVYHTRSFSSAVGDVEVTSPSPCEVVVRFLLSDLTLPTDALIAEIAEHLSGKTIRPLTDHVTVLAPTGQEFDVAMTYYINRSDLDKAVSIQSEVAKAIEDYISWQTGTIGRDINPSVLTEMVVAAGAKRVEVTSPVFTPVPAGTVPRAGSVNVTYGGVEDD